MAKKRFDLRQLRYTTRDLKTRMEELPRGLLLRAVPHLGILESLALLWYECRDLFPFNERPLCDLL
jgi:hypothetical protein